MAEMLEMIRSLGNQLRWASALEVPDIQPTSDVLFSGMGGSGIAGDFVAAVTSGDGPRVTTHKDYAPLPAWANRATPLVVGVSYSGNTEETLTVVEAADSAGCQVVALSTGGRLAELAGTSSWPIIEIPGAIQPRAALGYLFGSALRVVGAVSGVSDYVEDLAEAADIADAASVEGSELWKRAEAIAEGLSGRVAIIYGGGKVSGTAAQRWKTQLNENAKTPAWYSVLPEMNHNEIQGWETLAELTSTSIGVVGLSDVDDHPRVADRYLHSRNLTEFAGPWLDVVPSTGKTPTARIISLAVVGDLVSWMVATSAGVDPVPVGILEELKKRMKNEL